MCAPETGVAVEMDAGVAVEMDAAVAVEMDARVAVEMDAGVAVEMLVLPSSLSSVSPKAYQFYWSAFIDYLDSFSLFYFVFFFFLLWYLLLCPFSLWRCLK